MLSTLALNTSAKAATPAPSEHPYQGIVARNLFGLIPVPVPSIVAPKSRPLPKIVLTGIVSGFFPSRAVMKISLPPKPGEPAREQSCSLTVGERDGDLELLEIREKSGSVRVRYAGEEVPISFGPLDNVVRPAAASGNAAPIPAPPQPTVMESPMTPEEQVILMELEREKNKRNPNAPPIPPTELTSPEDAAAVMAPGALWPRGNGGRSQRAPR
jgi:hypothetical protein